jgi:very-short-patch-repair endonuclease
MRRIERVLPYDPHLKLRAAALRKNATLAEVLLWQRLKKGQCLGCDFHRQEPILHWVADFFCDEFRLVIEVDGDSHRFRVDEDARKETAFRAAGLTVLRFGDAEIKENVGAVVAKIEAWIREQKRGEPAGA